MNNDGTITITVTDAEGNVVSQTTEGTPRNSTASNDSGSDSDSSLDTFA